MIINYNTFKYPGKFDKTVTVFTGKGKEDAQVIHIVGYVEPVPMGVMEVNPRKVDLGTLAAGKANAVTLTVRNAGDAPMLVTKVESQKFRKTYWQGELTVPAGQSAAIALTLDGLEPGRFLDMILVHSDARNDIGKGYKAVLIGAVP